MRECQVCRGECAGFSVAGIWLPKSLPNSEPNQPESRRIAPTSVDGKQVSRKLADYNDQYRTKRRVRPLADEVLAR
jgi:hypothetical protein